MGTFSQSAEAAQASRKWVVVDAKGQTLGRLASQVAALLRGKHKATFTPHVDGGDFVVVINTKELRLSGKKLDTKIYNHHTGFPGGIKSISAGDLMAKDSRQLVKLAVEGMLPRGVLGRNMARKLKIYVGGDHPHAAQRPEKYTPAVSQH
jgi:large subunit ribosomal protein L13